MALLSLLLNTARIKEPRAALVQTRRTGPTSGCPVKIEELEIVSGVIRRYPRSVRGSHRIMAAKTARSAQSMRGLGLMRRRTATSCRRTRSSTSLVEDARPISGTSPSTWWNQIQQPQRHGDDHGWPVGAADRRWSAACAAFWNPTVYAQGSGTAVLIRHGWDDSGGFRSHRPGTHLLTGKSKRLCQARARARSSSRSATALGVLRARECPGGAPLARENAKRTIAVNRQEVPQWSGPGLATERLIESAESATGATAPGCRARQDPARPARNCTR